MLKIQEFISCFGDIKEANIYLRQGLGLSIIEEELVDDATVKLYLYNAGRHSDMADPLVKEANALILDEEANLIAKGPDHPSEALCPEELPHDFKLTKASVEEMPDGVMVLIYNLDGRWQIATAESVEGSNYIPGMDLATFTFEYEVKNLIHRQHGSWTDTFGSVSPDLCFVFDYVSPNNHIIMPYITTDMYLLSIINLEDGKELSPVLVDRCAAEWGYPRPTRSAVTGGESLSAFLSKIRPLSKGALLVDIDGSRVKIPNPIYYNIKSAKAAGERITLTHLAKILRSCRDKTDLSIVTSTFPEYKKHLTLLNDVKGLLYSELKILWNAAHVHQEDDREFAKMVQHHPLNYLLFMYKHGKIHSLKESVEELDPRRLAQLAKGKYEKEFATHKRSLQISNCGG